MNTSANSGRMLGGGGLVVALFRHQPIVHSHIFALETSQRLSHTLVYNCVCSFKCEAENVSFCPSSAAPRHTVRAVHLRKGRSSIWTLGCGKWV